VKLEQSIMRYALDVLSKKGYLPVEPPFMMRKEAYSGVTDLKDFGPVIYKIEGEDLYMIATSEHPLVAMHMDEIIEGKALPIKYAGISPCFRVEAGAHGRIPKASSGLTNSTRLSRLRFPNLKTAGTFTNS